MRRLFGFLIPDLRLEMQFDGGWWRSGAVVLRPVALSYKVTTHVNIVVTVRQEIKRHIFGPWKDLSFGGDLLYFPA
jgi:hypothetical protein